MRLGLAVDLGSTRPVRPQVDHVVALLAHAEKCGFDSAWVGESYHVRPEEFHLPASLVVLGHLAGRTSLHLGTAVVLLRAYSPKRLAYEGALLDQLCEGRLTLGVGLGSPEVSHRTGMPSAEPAGAAFDAAIRTIRSAWAHPSGAKEPDSPSAMPGPVQSGGPKILVGGKTAASVRRAATLADGYYGATNYTDELLFGQAAAYWSMRDDRLTADAGAVATTRLCLVHEDPATAQELADRYFTSVVDYYTKRKAWAGANGPGRVELPLVGSTAQVTESIRRYARAGVTSIQLRVAPHGTPPDIARRTIELVGDQILPANLEGAT